MSGIAYFAIDAEVSYPEYTALIYEHAASLDLDDKLSDELEGKTVQIVEEGIEKSHQYFTSNKNLDLAYFFACSAVHVADMWKDFVTPPKPGEGGVVSSTSSSSDEISLSKPPKKHSQINDVARRKRSSALLLKAITHCENIKNSQPLKNLYNKIMESIKSSQPERERLRKLQLENVETDAAAIADRNAKELESALEKGSVGNDNLNNTINNTNDNTMITSDETHIGLESNSHQPDSSAEAREARRQELLRKEQEALRLQQQQNGSGGGFGFDALVTGGGVAAGAVGGMFDAAASSSIPPPPPPITSPPPLTTATTTGDALTNLRNQFSDAISIANNNNSTPPQPQTSVIKATPTPVPTNNNNQPVTSIHQMPAPTNNSSPSTTTNNNTTASDFAGISLVAANPSTAPPATSTSSAALNQAREFLKSNPAPTPIVNNNNNNNNTPSPQTRTNVPTPPTTTTPTTSIVRPQPQPQIQQQQQNLLSSKRMFQFGRNAIWGYPRVPPRGNGLRRRGLVNLGNSCYLNSVIQCLCCTPLREVVARESNSRLACALSFVFRSLRAPGNSVTARTPVGPSAVKSAVASRRAQFGTMQQQDANEFFVETLDQLCEETHIKTGPKPTFKDIETRRLPDPAIAREFFQRFYATNNSKIGGLFAFQTRQMNMCNRCGESARNFDVMMTLDLPIPLGAPPGSVATLYDCLCLYTKPEVTPEGRDAFYKCEHCRGVRGSTHQTSIFSVPKILVVTLKRFRQVGTGNFSDKVNVPVVYPMDLDLSPFMLPQNAKNCPSTKLRLVGHVSHQGNTHGGHYTASSCDNVTDNQWWFSSDERLNEVGGNQADFAFSYMLFYVRVD